MRYGIWMSWSSLLIIGVLSVLAYSQVLALDTLGILEALLLCTAWLSLNAGKWLPVSAGQWTVTIALLAMIASIWSVDPAIFIYVPAVSVNLLLACFFFNSLRPGSDPAITRVARVEREYVDDKVYAYTRGVTWAWAFFFTGLVCENIALIALAAPKTTVLFLNALNYVLIVAFFLTEYIFRRLHLRGYAHISPIVLAIRLSRKGVMGLINYRKPL